MRNAPSSVRQNHTEQRHQDNLATAPAERADPRLEAGKSVELWPQQHGGSTPTTRTHALAGLFKMHVGHCGWCGGKHVELI